MAKRTKTKKSVARKPQVDSESWLAAKLVLIDQKVLLQALLIIAAGLWVFWPALHGDWLWDDDFYITQNPLLHDQARLWKAWFEPGSFIEYYPIHETVQCMQWHLWHNHTFGYH